MSGVQHSSMAAGIVKDLACFSSEVPLRIEADTTEIQVICFVDGELTVVKVRGRDLKCSTLGNVKAYPTQEGHTTYVRVVPVAPSPDSDSESPRTILSSTIQQPPFTKPHDIGSIKHLRPTQDTSSLALHQHMEPITKDVYRSNTQHKSAETFGDDPSLIDNRTEPPRK